MHKVAKFGRCAPFVCGAVACIAGLLGSAAPARAVGQFSIDLQMGTTLQANPDAVAAFQRAAAAWEQYIASPIRVSVFVDLLPLDSPNVIGQTGLGPINPNLDYTTVRNAMAARANRPGDGILAYLPTSAQVSANVPTAQGATFDNTTMGITSANQKALGIIDRTNIDNFDGGILFNSNFAFDYDQSDGVGATLMDFQTAATHEIGHVLGFLSDTDDFDFNPAQLDNATTLDMFRFSSGNLPTTPEQFTSFARELRPGQAASFTDLSQIYPFSTGAQHGDGNQASHWQDDFLFDPTTGTITFGPLIGIMDPTLSAGMIENISAADLRAMELIGYDVVPEPGGLALLVGACVLLVRRRH